MAARGPDYFDGRDRCGGHQHLALDRAGEVVGALESPERRAAGRSLGLILLAGCWHPDRAERRQRAQQLLGIGHQAHWMLFSHEPAAYGDQRSVRCHEPQELILRKELLPGAGLRAAMVGGPRLRARTLGARFVRT